MSSLDEKHLDCLYVLMRRAERENDANTAAVLRWAIFSLEQYLKQIERRA